MAKKTTEISSDLDFVKEFEELKLKQKLLIESLKRSGNNQQNKLFLEINSKLDFLVKIFTEANISENGEEKVDYESKFTQINDKLEELSVKIEDKFVTLIDKISPNSNVKPEIDNYIGTPEIESKPVESNLKEEKTVVETPLPPLPRIEEKIFEVDPKKEILPPLPNFELKTSEINSEPVGKKKRWF